MPRSSAIAVENNFRNGLVTEATGLNFPENACVETYDCVFSQDGSVQRRPGWDFEANFTTKNINRAGRALTTYLWKNVGGNGDLSVEVVQVGNTIYFYKTSEGPLSQGEINDTIVLTPVSGAPSVDQIEAQFSDGNGFLFITHPYIEPLRVEYDTATDTVVETSMTLQIRDFEGATADPYTITERPTATLAGLNEAHEYNLRNQGWTTEGLTAWDTAQTTMPSNADQMWRFKDANENLDFSAASIARITLGNTLAPKGHFILTLSNQNRDTAAGTTGVAATTSGHQRPSTSAFFQGRLWYAGINAKKYNSNIYFSQIVERNEQYAYCYQVNDPTAEELFDLLPSDGGVIKIPEAGTIHKLIPVPGGLVVFAINGIWFITGSTGIGFTANDHTIVKISSIAALTASSFVDVAGYPAWWNAEGIYILVAGQQLPTVQSITDPKIKKFFDEIPLASKRNARGFFNTVDALIQWIFRSEDTNVIDERYEFDRCLNFNTNSGAFYPWTITESDVKVHGILVTDADAGQVTVDQVVDSLGDNVITSGGDNVIVFTSTGSFSAPTFKYLVSVENDGGGHDFSFAEVRNLSYIDWFQHDSIGEDYSSYFVSGYKLRGEGLRKFQSNWLQMFSRIDEPVSFYVKGIWDYALTGSGTGRWSPEQLVQHTDLNYSNSRRRLKIRGHGLVLQFYVRSLQGEPFDIIGWSSLDSANQLP